MTLLQVFQEKIRCAARSGRVSDDDDLTGGGKIFRDLFVERMLLGNALSRIMRFLAVDQVALKSKGIVWLDGALVCQLAVIHVPIKTGGVMIDYYNRSWQGVELNRRFLWAGLLQPGLLLFSLVQSRFMQKSAETRNFFYFEVMGMRTLEERALRPHHEGELVASVWLDFTDLSNQLNNIAPRQITRQFAIDQVPQQNLKVVTDMSSHWLPLPFILRKHSKPDQRASRTFAIKPTLGEQNNWTTVLLSCLKTGSDLPADVRYASGLAPPGSNSMMADLCRSNRT